MGRCDYQQAKKKIGRRAPWLHPADPSLNHCNPYATLTHESLRLAPNIAVVPLKPCQGD